MIFRLPLNQLLIDDKGDYLNEIRLKLHLSPLKKQYFPCLPRTNLEPLSFEKKDILSDYSLINFTMRISIFTFLVTLFILNIALIQPSYAGIKDVVVDEYAIFDPATVDTSILADGMSIVDINGKKYLQVVVNGWNSIINVPEFTFTPGMTAFAEFKYVIGQDQYAATQIQAGVQLIDTVNLMKPSWSNDSVSTTTGLMQPNPSGKFVKTSANAAPTMKIVHQVQFFGQETSGYTAVAGDTLWVGKVRAYKVDDLCVFDPVTYDPDNLKEGMELVEVGGKKYLKVAVNGWNSALDINEFKFKDGVKVHTEFKYVVGQTQYTAAQINAAVQLNDTVNLMKPSWSNDSVASTTGMIQANPSGNFVKVSAALAPTMKVAHQVQFFGQETSGYTAVAGDTLWVGKVRAYAADPLAIIDPATFDPAELPAGAEIVKISGTSYFKVALNGWNTSFNVGSFVVPARTTHASMMVKLDPTGSGFELAKVNTFLKFSDPNWVEIVASGSASSADFGEYKLAIAAGDTIGIFQFAGQETTGWNAITGGYIYIGKVSAVQAPAKASITFVVDDTALKSSTGFGLKGSWNTATGEFDAAWNNGDEHAKFYDDGTHGDKTAGDNIWSVTLELVSDGGANSWEWGVNDVKGGWLYGNFKFTVADGKAQTLTHSNTVSAKNFGLATCKVYPNPATDFISIEGKEFKSVEIYNIAGVKVLSSKAISQQIDISSLKQGSYIVKALTTEGQNLISRFNKN